MVIRYDILLKQARKLLILVVILLNPLTLSSQNAPNFPVSHRIFNPFIMNPAVSGSKDFTSVDLLISNFGKDNSQLLSGNMRLSKSEKEYFTSVPTPDLYKYRDWSISV